MIALLAVVAVAVAVSRGAAGAPFEVNQGKVALLRDAEGHSPVMGAKNSTLIEPKVRECLCVCFWRARPRSRVLWS